MLPHLGVHGAAPGRSQPRTPLPSGGSPGVPSVEPPPALQEPPPGVRVGSPALTLPSPCSYFGFITKHPVLSRFACHVFVSQESMRHVAECVG